MPAMASEAKVRLDCLAPNQSEPVGSPAETPISRFRGRWPDEYEALPELEFWDDEHVLPHFPDGCIAVMYGLSGSHKTNTLLTMVLDAVLNHDARVCYAAG